ncbi:sulfite exporter TauE/SafE family protein [Solitalea koreensis]|uniref:Urease accessory protein UreH-like transmembrane domain-containing protein n=1 Tax=Solitalea koreensis TaxID=543615 RepID=A0A521BEX5_9SPHI|nr:sulfite exporter TauE/SafE family protein [Solitalea koreensis]SMO45665.1 hypothetical protein SAMN06265350_102149 [Solitalea koreensis]
MSIAIQAIVFGFVGSFHCIGMCGPIALALPFSNHEGLAKVVAIFTYNIGRIITYAIIGALFGLLGLGIRLAGYQQLLSISLGIFIIFSVLAPYLYQSNAGLLKKPISFISNKIGNLLKQSNYASLFCIGLLNGLLPCGFVYLGIVWTTSLANIGQGILFMVFFGLGTLPAMLGVSFATSMISIQWRNRIKRLVPSFIIILGMILIIRGLNLGIPYLSPEINHQQNTPSAICH